MYNAQTVYEMKLRSDRGINDIVRANLVAHTHHIKRERPW